MLMLNLSSEISLCGTYDEKFMDLNDKIRDKLIELKFKSQTNTVEIFISNILKYQNYNTVEQMNLNLDAIYYEFVQNKPQNKKNLVAIIKKLINEKKLPRYRIE